MPADQQAVLPTLRGVPWWGAVLVAVVITAVGAGIDARSTDELGATFKFCFLLGCVAAALLVRRRALFTAAAQPPLVAFGVGIITLYTVNADRASASLKSLILQVLLPIADVFPWLAITFLVTLALVVARWYVTKQQSATESSKTHKKSAPHEKSSRRDSSGSQDRTRSARKAADKRSATADGRESDVPEAASGEQTVVMPSGRSRTRRSHPRAPGGEPAPARSARTESSTRSSSAKTRTTPARTPAAGGQRRATAGQVSRAAAKSFIPGSPADERTEAFETPPERP